MSPSTRTIGLLLVLATVFSPPLRAFVLSNPHGQWHQLALSPAGRKGQEMEVDPPNQRIILFGGSGNTYFDDTWALNYGSGPVHWACIAMTGPHPQGRKQFTLTYTDSRNSMIAYGGNNSTTYALEDMWELHLQPGEESWEQIFPVGGPPGGINGQTVVYDPIANRLVMFGGRDDPYHYFNDTWSLDLGTLVWTRLSPTGTPPTARANFGSVYDPIGHRMIIFGGESDAAYWNDTWALDLTEGSEAWTRLAQTGPEPDVRSAFCMEYDPLRSRALLHGGQHWDPLFGFEFFQDMWGLDLSTDTWSEAVMANGQPPLRRNASSALANPGSHTIFLLFGGDLWDGGEASDIWLAEF